MSSANIEGTLGIYIEVVLGTPATYDIATIDAMPGKEKVGTVESWTDFGGTSGEDIFADAETGVECVVMTTRNYGSLTLSIASNPEIDAGQDVLKEGFDGVNAGAQHTYILHLPSGRRRMGTCKMQSYTENPGTAGNVYRGSVNLRLDNQVLFAPAP